MSGCSCTLMIIVGQTIYTGFIGDAMACVSKKCTSKYMENNTTNDELILTKPLHLPDEAKEKMRIYNYKGEIRGTSISSKIKYEDPDVPEQNSQVNADFQTGKFNP